MWPSKATWFSTALELPALFFLAPQVDAFFGIIMDPAPLPPGGAYPGPDGNAPGQAQDVFAPQQAQAEADAMPLGGGNAPAANAPSADVPSGEQHPAGDDESSAGGAAASPLEPSASANAESAPDSNGISEDDDDDDSD